MTANLSQPYVRISSCFIPSLDHVICTFMCSILLISISTWNPKLPSLANVWPVGQWWIFSDTVQWHCRKNESRSIFFCWYKSNHKSITFHIKHFFIWVSDMGTASVCKHSRFKHRQMIIIMIKWNTYLLSAYWWWSSWHLHAPSLP